MTCALCVAWTILWSAALSAVMSHAVPAPQDPLHPKKTELAAVDKAARPLAGLGLLLGGGGYFVIVMFIAGRSRPEH